MGVIDKVNTGGTFESSSVFILIKFEKIYWLIVMNNEDLLFAEFNNIDDSVVKVLLQLSQESDAIWLKKFFNGCFNYLVSCTLLILVIDLSSRLNWYLKLM